MLLHYILKAWKTNLLSLFFSLAMAMAKVLAALFNVQLLNALVALNRSRFLLYTSFSAFAWILYAVTVFLYYQEQTLSIQKMSLLLRIDIAKSIKSQQYSDFHQKDSDAYGSWLTNDINLIENNGFTNIFSAVTGGIDALISIIALISFHWSLVIVALLLSLLTVLIPQLAQKSLKKANLETTTANEQFSSTINDYLKGFDTLFVFHQTAQLVEKVSQRGSVLAQRKSKLGQATAESLSLGVFSNAIGQLSMTAWTGVLVLYKLTSVGTILATGSLAGNIFNSLATFGPAINAARAVNPVLQKYNLKVHQTTETKVENISSEKTSLSLSDVTYRYQQDELALAPVSFLTTTETNSKIAIIGESGSGKSTLLNILAGKLTNYSGSILINGQELSTLPLSFIQSTILYIDQIPYVFSGTIRDNLLLGEKYTDTQLWHALKESQLDDFIKTQPTGLDTLVGENGHLFSGGQRQRLALARGLLRNRKILLVDEGTNSLSQDSAIKLENIFLSLSNEIVIFVTHQLHDENKEHFNSIITILPPLK